MQNKGKKPFLNYSGVAEYKNNNYKFKMKDGSQISSCNFLKLYNPTFDNIFKKVFKNEAILLNFLNDLLFPKEKKIGKILIINTNFAGPYLKYSKGSVNLDICCKCFFKKENDSNNSINIFDFNVECDLVVDIEMQRITKDSPSQRFIKYISYIDANIACKKICSLVLLIAPKDKKIINNSSNKRKENNSSNIKYIKKSIPKYKEITEYENRIIIEVDLNYCYYLIEKQKEMWIVDKKSVLTKCGKEWIKLLTMQLWCQACEKEVYIFPWTNNLSFHQPQVEEAIQTLCQDEPFYSSIIEQELSNESNEEKIKELMKENEFQKKELQEKDKLLKEAYKELEKYKKREEDKSLDDIDYYDDEKDEDDDEDYIPEDIEMDDDNDY